MSRRRTPPSLDLADPLGHRPPYRLRHRGPSGTSPVDRRSRPVLRSAASNAGAVDGGGPTREHQRSRTSRPGRRGRTAWRSKRRCSARLRILGRRPTGDGQGQAFLKRFQDQVDPDGLLSPRSEHAGRSTHLRPTWRSWHRSRPKPDSKQPQQRYVRGEGRPHPAKR